jgi:hypothetical protein
MIVVAIAQSTIYYNNPKLFKKEISILMKSTH